MSFFDNPTNVYFFAFAYLFGIASGILLFTLIGIFVTRSSNRINPSKSARYTAMMQKIHRAAIIGTVFGSQNLDDFTQDEVTSFRAHYLDEVEKEAYRRATEGYSNHVKSMGFYRADDKEAVAAYNRGHVRGIETLSNLQVQYFN